MKGAAGIRRFAQEGLTAECRITDLEYDSGRDRLYAGTLGGGMLIISPSDLTVTGTAGEDLPISALHIDNDGTVWAGIQGGLLRYDPLMNRSSKDSLSAGSAATILCIYENSDGDMWAGTSDGLFQFKRNAESSRRYSASWKTATAISGSRPQGGCASTHRPSQGSPAILKMTAPRTTSSPTAPPARQRTED